MNFPSRDLTDQYISASYQDVLQKYFSGTDLYVLDGLGTVVFSIDSASIGYDVVTSNQTSSMTAGTASLVLASNVLMEKIDGVQFSSVQDMHNVLNSAGWISGGEMSEIPSSMPHIGGVYINSGSGLIRAFNNNTASILWFNWPSAILTSSIGVIEYIYVDYNGGNPEVTKSAVEPSDYQTTVLLGTVYHEHASPVFRVHVSNSPRTIGNSAALVDLRLKKTIPYGRESGLTIGEGGDLTFNITSGEVWDGLRKIDISSFTSGSTFSTYWRVGSAWTASYSQSIDNLRYNDTTIGLVSPTGSAYLVHWVYETDDDHVVTVYHTEYFTDLTDANAAQKLTDLPPSLTVHGFLVGKIVLQTSASAFDNISSAFDTIFSPAGVTIHNSLTNIQGGQTNEYYHLTSTQYNSLIGAGSYRTVVSSSVISSTGSVAYVSASTSNIIVTMPTASAVPGQFFRIKKIDSTGYEVIITGSGMIEYGTQLRLSQRGSSVTLHSDSTRYWIH